MLSEASLITIIAMMAIGATLIVCSMAFGVVWSRTAIRARRFNIFIPFRTSTEIGSAWNSIVTKLSNENGIILTAYCPPLVESWDQGEYYPRIVATYGSKKKMPTNTLVLTGELPDKDGRYSIQGYLRYFNNKEIHPALKDILKLAEIEVESRDKTKKGALA